MTDDPLNKVWKLDWSAFICVKATCKVCGERFNTVTIDGVLLTEYCGSDCIIMEVIIENT